jgi:molecular chaperone DnaK
VRGNIDSALNNLKDALKSEDGDRIKKTLEALEQASHKLAEEMYKSQATDATGAAPPPPGPEAATDRGGAAGGEAKKDEDVIDAEYEVKE